VGSLGYSGLWDCLAGAVGSGFRCAGEPLVDNGAGPMIGGDGLRIKEHEP